MKLHIRLVIVPFMCISVILLSGVPLLAGWETGARVGFDSNVNRAVSGGKGLSDSYLSTYLSYYKGPSGETRWNWTFDATLQAAAYTRVSDLSFAQATVAPALVYYPYRLWSITAAPFLQGKAAVDSDFSALAIGGKLTVREQINPTFYLAQYYLYKKNSAMASTYSFSQNTLGALAGVNWTKNIFTELLYEYSREDSFFSTGHSGSTILASQPAHSMMGGHTMFSTVFDETVVREKVDRHSIGVLAGIDWTKSIFSTAGYAFSTFRGGSGTANSHAASITAGIRF